MQKLAVLLSFSAVALSIFAIIRRETEIRKDNEILELVTNLMTELQFAKIVDHLEGDK
jgi:hypothetical protein